MQYMGSKRRLAKYILPIILKNRQEGQWYIEPCVGGGNSIAEVEGNRIGGDSNIHTINALRKIQNELDTIPKNNIEFTESDYKILQLKSKTESNTNIGFCGFAYSFGGKWFNGWCRNKENRRDYVAEAYKNAIIQSPKLYNVKLIHSSYENLEIPPNSIIYCDPPYQGTTKYNTSGFDYPKFWDWCRAKTLEGHEVYISEYSAPSDFTCIFEKEIGSGIDYKNHSKKATEKLFIYKL